MGLSVNDVSGIGAVANLAGDLIDRLFPDKIAQAKERSEYLIKAQELDTQLAQGQLAINQAEAASDNLFVAGWRPFIGWTCGIAFCYHFVLEPLFMLMVTCYRGVCIQPDFNMDTLTTVLMGMLGLGSLRTIEKLAPSPKFPWQK